MSRATMIKKDLGCSSSSWWSALSWRVINPRFLSPVNLSNTANLIGLFGIFAIAPGLRHHHRRHRAFGRLDHRAARRHLRRSHRQLGTVNSGRGHRRSSSCIGCLIGAIHGYLIAKVGLQPFVVTLCGLLIYRGVARYYTDDATAGFPFGASFPTLEWLTTGRIYGIPHSLIAFVVDHRRHGGRAAPLGVRPLSLRRRQERGGGALLRHPHRRASSSRPTSSAAA